MRKIFLAFAGICLTLGSVGCKSITVGVAVTHHSQYGDLSLNLRSN